MLYYKSTRNSKVEVSAAQAIAQGISSDGGLFVPSEIPTMTIDEIVSLGKLSYPKRAAEVFSKYLTDFTADELKYCTEGAYNTKAFDTENICEIKHLADSAYMLELWHGPTCAFKDMALQILPYFVTVSVKKAGLDKKVVILVATSGDTGKAALEGFKDVPGTEIMVFYPEDGVSPMQKKQMTTQEGENVGVCAIKGNFDDAQNGVKAIFTDPEVVKALDDNGKMFSSANSINWGRLAPQIVYYVSSYAELVKSGKVAAGEKINIVVPTGNFGNILAGYYAKLMGVPVNKLICASNSNNVLTDFLTTGVYDKNRHFYTTISPSMDILISSNLERLLYLLSGESDETINDWFGKLKTDGRYEVTPKVLEKIKESFSAGYTTDNETKAAIAEHFKRSGYLMDTHTAVAVKVYEDYLKATGDKTVTLIASTANPYKFSAAVLDALGEADDKLDEFELVDKLERVSGMKAPKSLAELKNKDVRFKTSIEKGDMKDFVVKMLS